METNQSYKTAYVSAYARLIEQYEPKETRLFNDLVVKHVFSNYISFLLKINFFKKILIFMYNITSTGLMGLQVCRTKYIDDLLKEEIEKGIEQIVILGSGFDTRPYRITGINKVKVFEVDLPIIVDKKQAIIKKQFGKTPDNVIFTPIDFNIQKIEEVLKSKGLDLSKPIFFIWEGVTQYLSEEAIDYTLKFISATPYGSKVVFTYIIKNVIDGNIKILGGSNLVNFLEMGEQSWRFGLNQLEVSEFIDQYNLELIEDVGTSYFKENYLKPIDRKLEISEFERIIFAKVV